MRSTIGPTVELFHTHLCTPYCQFHSSGNRFVLRKAATSGQTVHVYSDAHYRQDFTS